MATATVACSVVLRQKCATRTLAERDGQAYWSMWDGFLYPLTEDLLHDAPFSWHWCPFCGGDVRLGIRDLLDKGDLPPTWLPEPWTPDEGEE